jgi:hypothetical protein
MKKAKNFLILAFLFIGLSAHAGIITVSNHSNSPGNYIKLQDAIDAAVPGDTIYVTGSGSSYGNISINKKLTLIGAGYNPNNQFGFKSQVGQVDYRTGTDNFGQPSNPSGSEITGFEIYTLYVHQDNINNITVSRNRFTYYPHFYSRNVSGWIFKNNILNSVEGCEGLTSTIFTNNIMFSYFSGLKSPTITITNNIFLTSGGKVFNNVTYAIVTNNIFFGKTTEGANYCTFNNNISFGGASTSFNYANNSAQNNKENVNPLFVNAADVSFKYENDYHLQPSSPGVNAGTDGKHIGIYGGSFPFPGASATPYQTSPMPPVPQIMKMNVQNSVLPQNGTLNVQIEAVSNP